MGTRRHRRYDEQVRRYFTPRCLGLHVILLILLPTFALLTQWQLSRALGGNTLSWAYTFEWPLFAGYAIYVWWQLIHESGVTRGARRRALAGETTVGDGHDEPGWALSGGRRRNVAIAASHPIDEGEGGHGERFVEQTPEEAAALAEYNRYLAELSASDERHPAR
jgi:hypothetical protein